MHTAARIAFDPFKEAEKVCERVESFMAHKNIVGREITIFMPYDMASYITRSCDLTIIVNRSVQNNAMVGDEIRRILGEKYKVTMRAAVCEDATGSFVISGSMLILASKE